MAILPWASRSVRPTAMIATPPRARLAGCLLVLLLPAAAGFSGGGGESGAGQSCDAINVCAIDYGVTGGAGNPIGVSCPPGMSLVAPPVRSSIYEVSAAATYVPDELTEITIRVTNARIAGKRNAGASTTGLSFSTK